jgi:hypothetical protein
MRIFKLTDICISTALIIYFSVEYIVAGTFEKLISAYVITGAWQTISMIVHALKKGFVRKWSTRFIYHWITFICLATFPAGSPWILLFTAPFMAVFYTGLCINEYTAKDKRPLSYLK